MSEKSFKQYRCEECDKYYSSYQSLWIHNKKTHAYESKHKVSKKQISSKHVVDKGNFKCHKCDKVYKHKQSRYRHELSCIEKNQELTNTQNNSLTSNTNNALTSTSNSMNNSQMNHANMLHGNNNNVDNSVTLNYYNNDNLSFITPEFFKKLLKETLFEEDHPKVLPKVIEEVKYNKEHKENHNVKLDKKKKKTAEVYTKEGWKKIDEEVCIDYLTKRGYQIYKNLSNLHQEQIKGRYVDSNNNFTENYLNGNITEDTKTNMKETVKIGTNKINSQTRKELEEELSKELVL